MEDRRKLTELNRHELQKLLDSNDKLEDMVIADSLEREEDYIREILDAGSEMFTVINCDPYGSVELQLIDDIETLDTSFLDILNKIHKEFEIFSNEEIEKFTNDFERVIPILNAKTEVLDDLDRDFSEKINNRDITSDERNKYDVKYKKNYAIAFKAYNKACDDTNILVNEVLSTISNYIESLYDFATSPKNLVDNLEMILEYSDGEDNKFDNLYVIGQKTVMKQPEYTEI